MGFRRDRREINFVVLVFTSIWLWGLKAKPLCRTIAAGILSIKLAKGVLRWQWVVPAAGIVAAPECNLALLTSEDESCGPHFPENVLPGHLLVAKKHDKLI